MTAVGGSCFGFEVTSSLPLSFLREPGGDGGPALRVSVAARPHRVPDAEPLLEWLPGDDVRLRARLYDGEPGYLLWIEGVGCYRVDPVAPSIEVPASEEPLRREERLWGIPAMLCFLQRGDVPLHASAVQVGDGAMVVGAPSGFGKTTLAAAFWREGHRVLSEDLTCLRASGPSVVPGPALLRLRPDMAERLLAPDYPPADARDGRVVLSLTGEAAGDSRPVPLHGIVLLGGEAGEVTLTRIDPVDAIPGLWGLSFTLPEQAEAARCFRALADLASGVPVWELRRPLGVEELPRIVEAVASHA